MKTATGQQWRGVDDDDNVAVTMDDDGCSPPPPPKLNEGYPCRSTRLSSIHTQLHTLSVATRPVLNQLRPVETETG